MRISDWSSDVCSSDLIARAHRLEAHLGLEHRDRPFEEVFFLAGVEAPGLDVFDALPAVGLVDTYIDLIAVDIGKLAFIRPFEQDRTGDRLFGAERSEEHTSELQSLMRSSYAVFCLKKKKKNK